MRPVNSVNTRSALLASLVALFAAFAPQTADAASALDVLPAGWRADGGIPVELSDGRILTLFGDTFTETHSGNVLAGGFVHNTVIIGGTVITNAIKNSASGSYFWPMDALELPDGSVLVLASEVVVDSTSWFGFRSIDTDGFVVSDPSSAWSWRNARKVDDGPWGSSNVMFLDTDHTLAAVRDAGVAETVLYQVNPLRPTDEWQPIGGEFPSSDGVFAPVQTAAGWFGVSWRMDESATVWHSSSALGPWEQVRHIDEVGLVRYGHSLSVVAGQVWLRFSNGVGTQRVAYEPFSVEG